MNWLKQFLARPWASIIALKYYTLFGMPYYKMIIFRIGRGECGVDAHYNIHFIYELDNAYAQAESDYYNANLEDQAKVAIYMYHTVGNIAEKYMPLEELVVDGHDIETDVPPMAFRDGGEPVTTVVDLAEHPGNIAAKSPLDVKMG